jgi:alkanesulfonate monooxygenase SsuD/methylene tetrahydromethanopterin reductase-like flavin-dependent oxidoreductase (luciferase family)
VVSEDSAAAKRAARILVAFYISSMPPEQLARHGIDASELQPVVDALGTGDIPKAVELFRPEYAEKLSLAGTPEECVEKIKTDLQPAGVNHMILALSTRRWSQLAGPRQRRVGRHRGVRGLGRRQAGRPDPRGVLHLVHAGRAAGPARHRRRRAAARRRRARHGRHRQGRGALPPGVREKLSLAGTPEECVEKIKTDLQPAGVNHMILACRIPRSSSSSRARTSRTCRTSTGSCGSSPSG